MKYTVEIKGSYLVEADNERQAKWNAIQSFRLDESRCKESIKEFDRVFYIDVQLKENKKLVSNYES